MKIQSLLKILMVFSLVLYSFKGNAQTAGGYFYVSGQDYSYDFCMQLTVPYPYGYYILHINNPYSFGSGLLDPSDVTIDFGINDLDNPVSFSMLHESSWGREFTSTVKGVFIDYYVFWVRDENGLVLGYEIDVMCYGYPDEGWFLQ